MIKTPKPKSILRKRRIRRHPISGVKVTTNASNSGPTVSEPAKKKSSLRFAGPIKIIVVDPKSEYCKTVWCAIGIALTNVAIGSVLMAAIFYAIAKEDPHVAVCTVASSFFTTEAILALHYANGWSAPMRTRHKKFAHILLNLCGILCIIIGTAIAIVTNGVSATAHCITGIITMILLLFAAIFGPLAYWKRRKWLVTLHMSIGIPAFISSAISTCLGFTLHAYTAWSGVAVVYILIGLILYYTVFIVTSSFIKCVSRI